MFLSVFPKKKSTLFKILKKLVARKVYKKDVRHSWQMCKMSEIVIGHKHNSRHDQTIHPLSLQDRIFFTPYTVFHLYSMQCNLFLLTDFYCSRGECVLTPQKYKRKKFHFKKRESVVPDNTAGSPLFSLKWRGLKVEASDSVWKGCESVICTWTRGTKGLS